eukprot:8112478-Pyramimonas_sp.AAC.1
MDNIVCVHYDIRTEERSRDCCTRTAMTHFKSNIRDVRTGCKFALQRRSHSHHQGEAHTRFAHPELTAHAAKPDEAWFLTVLSSKVNACNGFVTNRAGGRGVARPKSTPNPLLARREPPPPQREPPTTHQERNSDDSDLDGWATEEEEIFSSSNENSNLVAPGRSRADNSTQSRRVTGNAMTRGRPTSAPQSAKPQTLRTFDNGQLEQMTL